jgi:hypothetical protein
MHHINPSTSLLHASIQAHCKTRFCQSVSIVKGSNQKYKKYRFFHAGMTHEGGGVIGLLERRFYPHYETNRSRRNHKNVMVRGSNSNLGKTVDRQLCAWTVLGGAGKRPKRLNKLAGALMKYLEDIGHTAQAAQFPAVIPNVLPLRMTQADLITKDGFGRMWLWEVKTGFPVGGFRKQDVFQGRITDANGMSVPCTKYNIWQLQLHFTRLALESAGIHIDEARVIQVFENKAKAGVQIKVHPQPEWVNSAKI